MIQDTVGAILYQTPGAQQFLRLLTEDFANRRSVVILVPDAIDRTLLWTQIEGIFWQRSIWYQSLSVSELQHQGVPLIALAHALNGDACPNLPRSIGALLEESEMYPNVLVLSGIEYLAAPDRLGWIRFINRWAEECQGLVGRGNSPPSLFAILPISAVEHSFPESNVQLALHWYWGFPSALEMQLLCQLIEQPDEHQSNLARWRGHILPALAGNDVSLLTHLWDCCTGPLEDLWSALHCFATERGWTEAIVRSWQADELLLRERQQYGQRLATPPVALQRLWACDALLWTPEYGLELHPAALIVLQRHHELNHRVWRGQAKLLLPLLDQVRLEICDSLTRSYGSEWPFQWDPPRSYEDEQAVHESPLACQWGHLEWLLRNCSQLRAERRYIPLASCAWKIRNRIAHYCPVNFSDFSQLASEIRRSTVPQFH